MTRAMPAISSAKPVLIAILAAAAALLAGCADPNPLYGPGTFRDGGGRPVDPVYGTPLPGGPAGFGGM